MATMRATAATMTGDTGAAMEMSAFGSFAVGTSVLPWYRQQGWHASEWPILHAALAVLLLTWLFDTYVHMRQHAQYSVTEFPPVLARFLRRFSTDHASVSASNSGSDGEAVKGRREAGSGSEGDAGGGEVEGTQPRQSLYDRTLAAFKKSQVYGRDKSTFQLAASVYDQVMTLGFYVGGAYPFLWDVSAAVVDAVPAVAFDREIAQSCVFMGLFLLASTVLSLPFSIYSTFVLEQRHGFNKQTAGTFVGDLVKRTILSMCIGGPIVALLVLIVRSTGELFWLYCWLFVFATVLILMTVYPNFIAPCFNKFTPLDDGPLRERIERLAQRLSFPLKKLFVVDGSRRSAHSNAYMYGFCGNKRIVLYDTLLKQASPQEIEAILGHELGHWKHGHTLSMMAISQTTLFVQFYLFGLFVNRTELLESFGFNPAAPATMINLLLFFEVAFSPLGPLLTFASNAVTRKFEFAADHFAAALGYTKHLQSGLVKLHVENLGTLVVDPLYSAYHYSHPPLVERLAALDEVHED